MVAEMPSLSPPSVGRIPTIDIDAPKIPADLLSNFRLTPKPGREAISTFYLVRAAVLDVQPKQTNLLVTLGTPEGDLITATMPWVDTDIIGELCWVILVVHPQPGSPDHCHILRIWSCDPLSEFGSW